ncbi:MAG: cob(I)yrinic acid a,c-diamide adenosyltransferase [Nanoarchaeota archaeon]|nr:cob(I)yrinic acid a,c-diamide adenosyltransferase [Nanoarchaeota archaeon]
MIEKSSLGLVHIYTGEGKGKTSAGMGLVVRALGRGLKVKIIQLFKRDTGEQFFFENSGIKYIQFKPLHPYFKNYDSVQLESLKKEFLIFWEDVLRDIDEYDVILIDEAGPGINWGIIPEELIFNLIKNKPRNTELILTGRDFPLSVKDKADYVSEIKHVKHPYDKGILAREGIEY